MLYDTTLRYIVKAPDLQGALDSAGGYEVSSVSECCDEKMEDCWNVTVELSAQDLNDLLGKPGKGTSFTEAAKRAKMVEDDYEKRRGPMTVGY